MGRLVFKYVLFNIEDYSCIVNGNSKLCFLEEIMEDHKLIKHVKTLQSQAFQNFGIGSEGKLLYSN